MTKGVSPRESACRLPPGVGAVAGTFSAGRGGAGELRGGAQVRQRERGAERVVDGPMCLQVSKCDPQSPCTPSPDSPHPCGPQARCCGLKFPTLRQLSQAIGFGVGPLHPASWSGTMAASQARPTFSSPRTGTEVSRLSTTQSLRGPSTLVWAAVEPCI